MSIIQLFFKKGSFIDTIELDAFITEEVNTLSVMTSNPIQNAADSTDHIILQPMTFTIEGVISNASASGIGIGQLTRNVFTGRKDTTTWQALIDLQASKKLFKLVQGLKIYPNVQIVSLSAKQDKDTSKALFFTAHLREIITPIGTVQDQYGTQNIYDQMSPAIVGGVEQVGLA